METAKAEAVGRVEPLLHCQGTDLLRSLESGTWISLGWQALRVIICLGTCKKCVDEVRQISNIESSIS